MKSIRCARAKIFAALSFGLTAALIAGCASRAVDNPHGMGTREVADERGFVRGTGIELQDIVAVTDKMARGIMAVQECAHAPKPPQIMLLPVKNNTPFAFNRDIFVNEIMAHLNERAAGKVRFVMGNRIDDADPNVAQVKGADFLLTGKLAAEKTTTSAGTTDYVLYSFELINPNSKEIIWNGAHRLSRNKGHTDKSL